MGSKMSAEYHAEYFQKNKDKFAEYRRRHRKLHPDRTQEQRKARLSNYNLNLAEYDRLLIAQNYVCAICGEKDDDCNLSVDHDHACCPGTRSCGKCIRGLLCKRCNSVLGYIKDSLDLLSSMLVYLRGVQNV